MNRLSLQEAMNLLGVEDVDGTHGQLERLRRWVEGLVERHGNEYVSENRCKLLTKWTVHKKLKMKNCC